MDLVMLNLCLTRNRNSKESKERESKATWILWYFKVLTALYWSFLKESETLNEKTDIPGLLNMHLCHILASPKCNAKLKNQQGSGLSCGVGH